jgi:hypothetical protein
MSRIGLSPEQRRLVEHAGNEPVRIDDPDTRETYILLREEVYRRLGGRVGSPEADRAPSGPADDRPVEIPEGLRRSREAFLRALPGLLARPRLQGRWVAFRGDEQVGLARGPEALIRECVGRGLAHDQYYVGCIRPHAAEPEEVDPSLFEYEDFPPHP